VFDALIAAISSAAASNRDDVVPLTALQDRIHCYLPGWDVPRIAERNETDHFGLVSDFLIECRSRLRGHGRASVLQGRLTYGGALSGRDQNAVNTTISGLLKLIHPSPEGTCPTRTWNGQSGWGGNAAAASRNSRSGSSWLSSAARSSATRWVRTGSRSSW
jgi:hypothetical protein